MSGRKPDPSRLVDGYFHAAATLNYCRSLLSSGFADLHSSTSWDLGFVKDHPTRARYLAMVERILSALDFMSVCGVDDSDQSIRTVEHFTSHEGLTLAYEEALTRKVDGKYYNLSGHMLWIGARTGQLDGAHVEFFRGIENPVGVKVGPDADPSEVVELVRTARAEGRRTALVSAADQRQVEALAVELFLLLDHRLALGVCDLDPGCLLATSLAISGRVCGCRVLAGGLFDLDRRDVGGRPGEHRPLGRVGRETHRRRPAIHVHHHVTVTAGDAVWTREVQALRTYGQSSTRVHLGLGERETVDEVHIAWPDGAESTVHELAADGIHEVAHPDAG